MKQVIRVIIGRFQVPRLTAGHVAFMDKVDPHVILLGVSPLDGRDARNPYTYGQRANNFGYKRVFPVFDHPNDAIWSAQVDRFLEQVYPEDDVVLYGGRLSFLPHYKGHFKTIEVPSLPHPSGEEERAKILLTSNLDFMAGQAYTLAHAWPHVFGTVDIACFEPATDSRKDLLLLIKRADTGEWGLPGGFVDPDDLSLEAAAKRELWEEVGINIETGRMDYVRSFKIPDYRYRGSKDGIMTTLFKCDRLWGNTQNVNPREVADFMWASKGPALEKVCAIHRPLVEAVFP